jgi:hypothetical protein
MTTSRLTTAFTNLDTTPFTGKMIAVLTQNVTTLADGTIYVGQSWPFTVKAGQAYATDGVTLASLPVTQVTFATPGNVPIAIYQEDSNGALTWYANVIIPPESGGPVALASLPTVAVDLSVVYPSVTGMTIRGPWSSVLTYNIHDLVFYQGSVWHAKIAVIANQTPAVGSGYWDLYQQGGMYNVAWTATQPYILNDVVVSGGTSWVCKQAHTNQAPAAGSAYWVANPNNITGLAAAAAALEADEFAVNEAGTQKKTTLAQVFALLVARINTWTGFNRFSGGFQITGPGSVPAAGSGLEVYGGASVILQAYNRVVPAWLAIRVAGSVVTLEPNGTPTFTAAPTLNTSTVPIVLPPTAAGALPSAATLGAGATTYATGLATGPQTVVSDGTVWRTPSGEVPGAGASPYAPLYQLDMNGDSTQVLSLAGPLLGMTTTNRSLGRKVTLVIKSFVDAIFTRATPANDPYTGAGFIAGMPRFVTPQNNKVNGSSEDLTNAAWTKINVAINPIYTVSINCGSRVLTLQKVNDSTTNGLHYVAQAAIMATTGNDSQSFYARADSLGFAYATFGDGLYAYFNLVTGATATVNAGLTAEMHSVGNGVYRCCAHEVGAGPGTMLVGVCAADNTSSYAGTGEKGAYIGGLMGENNATTTGYQPVGPSTGNLGLMVEQAVTNLLTANQSSVETDLTGFSANTGTIARVTTDHWTGTACLQCNTVSAGDGAYIVTGGLTIGQTYTFAIHAKSISGDKTLLTYDPTVGAVQTMSTTEWRWLKMLTFTATATVHAWSFYNANGAGVFLVDGLQLEVGSIATSWTLGGTTRAAETETIPTSAIKMSLTAGTLFFKVYVDGDAAAVSRVGAYVLFEHANTGTTNDQLNAYFHPSGFFLQSKNTAGTLSQGSWVTSLAAGYHLFLVKYSAAELSLWEGGVKRITIASPNLPGILQSNLSLFSFANGAGPWNRPAGFFGYLASAVSDADAAAYTNPHDPSVPARLNAAADYFIDYSAVSAANGGNQAPARAITTNPAHHVYAANGVRPTVLPSGKQMRLTVEAGGPLPSDIQIHISGEAA